MSDQKKKIIIPKNHRLVTRRDFLSHGLVAGVSYSMAPSLLSLLRINEAHASENCIAAAGNMDKRTPMIIIDLAGGGNIPGSNVLVGDQAGQHSYIPDYKRLGLPDNMHPSNQGMVNSEMGLKFHSDSAMLDGIQARTSATVRSKVEGAVFCGISSDDTGNNPHNPVYWLNKAGAVGDIAQTAGTRISRSGGRSTFPPTSYDPTIAPVPVRSPDDAVELISLGRVHDIFNDNQAKSVLRTIQNMSETRLAAFSEKTLPQQIREVVECGYSKANIDLRVHNNEARYQRASIDPMQDSDVTDLWDVNNGNGGIRNQQRREASMAKLVLDGYIGTGTIEMGGYDYHSSTRSESDSRDRRVGELIGRIMSLAARKQKDVAIYVFTDGGISSNMQNTDPNANGKYNFTNDDGLRTSTFMMVYKHSGRPTLMHTGGSFNVHKRQVGWFTNNSVVDASAGVMSNNVTNLAKTVVANYLALHGDIARLEEVLGDNPFGNSLDNYLIFDDIG
jgi:hypothetical protein